MGLRAGVATVAVLIMGCGLVAGCTGDKARPGAAVGAPCRAVAGSGFSWPPGVPASLPVPPDARPGTVQHLSSGFTLVTFTTPGVVRDNLLRFTSALQEAGYTVGRGIVGASQSRLPFTRNGKPGVLQLSVVDACSTRWQLQA